MTEVRIGKVIKYVSASLEKQANSLLKKEDISLSQGILLIWLSEASNKELPIKDIEKKYGTAQSTTYGIVARLESKGYVESYSINNKTKIVKLCNAGASKIDFVKECVLQSEKEMFKGFTDGEKALFTEFLVRAENNLNQ